MNGSGRPGVDYARVGGIDWLERTKGALTSSERRRFLRPILQGQAEAMAGRLALLAGRRPSADMAVPNPPDSALAREAEEAAAEQPADILGHSYRTWAFGRALAAVDHETVDEELFYVASLLHDAGLTEAVAGEDFTLRSAAAAMPMVEKHRDHAAARCVGDAISGHCTPGASLDVDGPETFYVQSGAVLDLGGLRLHHLARTVVDEVLRDHPRDGLPDAIVPRINAEAKAVPDGRFAVLRKSGFGLAVRMAPLPK